MSGLIYLIAFIMCFICTFIYQLTTNKLIFACRKGSALFFILFHTLFMISRGTLSEVAFRAGYFLCNFDILFTYLFLSRSHPCFMTGLQHLGIIMVFIVIICDGSMGSIFIWCFSISE